MIKTHFSAAELARLPGMPTTARRVTERAKKGGWPYRQRAAVGGGREYPITCLPADVQAALAEKDVSAAPGSSPSPSSSGTGAYFFSRALGHEDGVAPCAEAGEIPAARSATLSVLFDSKPESVKAEARARLELVTEFHRLVLRGFKRDAVIAAVTGERNVSEATLTRYLGLVRGEPSHQWLPLLCPAYAGRTSTADMSAEAWETLKADYLRPERPSAKACVRRLLRHPESRGWTLPSVRTMERRLKDLPLGVKVGRREGTKALKALYPPQQRDKSALFALAIINGDGYKHNLWARFPDGEVARPKTWFWQDVHSSKILAWRTDKTEHTEVIQLSFGDLCERYGIPHAVTIDNTLAAANKTMSGGVKHRFRFKVREDEPDGVFKLLGVAVHWATPGHGQAKPVERVFGIGGVGEYIDKAPEFAGAWSGSSPNDKPEYDGRHRAVDLAKLEEVIAREIAAFNAMPNRRGAIQQGRSFDDVFNDSYARAEIRKATEAQRRFWLLSTEPVHANSLNGSIALDAGRVKGERLANRYWHPEMLEHAGRELVAKFDPRRLHQGVHIYSLDGRWICYAECDRPAGFNDAAAARERNRARNIFMRNAKQLAAAEVRMSTLDVAKGLQLPTSGGPADSSIPAPKVSRLLVDALERPRFVPTERSDDEIAELARAEALQPASVNVLELRSDADKHAHWRALDERRAAGEQLAGQDAHFWQHWQHQDYYRIALEAEQEFERGLATRRIA